MCIDGCGGVYRNGWAAFQSLLGMPVEPNAPLTDVLARGMGKSQERVSRANCFGDGANGGFNTRNKFGGMRNPACDQSEE